MAEAGLFKIRLSTCGLLPVSESFYHVSNYQIVRRTLLCEVSSSA